MRQLQMQHKLNEIYTLRNIAIGYAIKEHSRWNGIVKKNWRANMQLDGYAMSTQYNDHSGNK